MSNPFVVFEGKEWCFNSARLYGFENEFEKCRGIVFCFFFFFFVYKLDSAVGFGFRDIREKFFGTISLDSVYRVPPRQYTR